MTNETNNKLAAILAAQQAKAKVKTTTAFKAITPTPTPQPEPQPEVKKVAATAEKSKLSLFNILWHEGSSKYDGKTFVTWAGANEAMTAIYNEHSGAGYLKVKVCISFEDGAELTLRTDCSESAGDFCPTRENIGQYIYRTLNNCKQGAYDSYSFEDEIKPQDTVKYKGAELTAIVDSIDNEMPMLPVANITFEDGIKSRAYIADLELSDFTLEQLMSEEQQPETKEETPAPAEPTTGVQSLKFVDYSPISFAIVADANTYPVRKILNELGTYNRNLKCGAGWIFSKKKYHTVRVKLGLTTAQP